MKNAKRLLTLILAIVMVLNINVNILAAQNIEDSDADKSEARSDVIALTNASSATDVVGDMNGDGVVDGKDAIYLLRHVLMPQEYPVEDSGDADLNGDGILNGADTVYLFRNAVVRPGYEDMDFGGKVFVIAGADGAVDGFSSRKEIYSEEADAISVAVRERNELMKTLYNCNIKLNSSSDPASLVRNEIAANQHTIDLYTHHFSLGSSATGGNNLNLYTLGLDLTNDWWDQEYVNAYSVKNEYGNQALYSIVGDFALTAFDCAHALVFNKDVYENAQCRKDLQELETGSVQRLRNYQTLALCAGIALAIIFI